MTWFLVYGLSPGPDVTDGSAVVFIPRGSSGKQIGKILAEQKLIFEDVRFYLLARVMARSARLQAGEFQLHTGQTPIDVIRELADARPVEHSVTIPEGLSIEETAAVLARAGWVDQARFISRAYDAVFISSLGLKEMQSLEGYLFPDTYFFVKPAPGEDVVLKKLVEQSLAVWKAIDAEHDTELSRHDVFILASMIEKESGVNSERPIIAAVFFNRLKKKMRLQSDPTVIYGLEDKSGPLRKTDLKTPTPYNTYTLPALPAGPICSPGEASLRAVYEPTDVDYLYFVAKNDGTHHFSKTLREHNLAVRTFQRVKKKTTDQ